MEVLERSVRCVGSRIRSQFEAHDVSDFPLHGPEPIGRRIPLRSSIPVDLPGLLGAVPPSRACCRYSWCSPTIGPGSSSSHTSRQRAVAC